MKRICVIGCGAKKLSRCAPARELYTGPLFTDALGYAEAHCFDLTLVLSAYYGLLDLEREVDPYELQLADLGTARRAALGAHVRSVLRFRAGGPAELTILAVADFALLLRPLSADGWAVHEPLAGLGQGERRAWFAAQRRAG